LRRKILEKSYDLRTLGQYVTWAAVIFQPIVTPLFPLFFFKQPPLSTPLSVLLGYGLILFLFAIIQAGSKLKSERWTSIQSSDLRFFEHYSELLSKGMLALTKLRNPSDSRIATLQRNILILIAAIVNSTIKREGVEVSANLMLPKIIEEEDFGNYVSNSHFIDPNLKENAFQCVLVCVESSSPLLHKNFALPVANDDHYLLFGAPRAFVKLQTQYIDDTLNKAKMDVLLQGLNPIVAQNVHNYFQSEKEKIRSFASIPLISEKTRKCVGVLNIHANLPSVCGVKENKRREICMLLRPFLTLLTVLVEWDPGMAENEKEGDE
jgi:hypothetical protein